MSLFFKMVPFAKTIKRLERLQKLDPTALLEHAGKEGVKALSHATPVDTGGTARSWYYTIERSGDVYRLIWKNTVMAGRTPLVIILQIGHGTRDGHYIPGRDFINPALDPIYRDFKSKLRKEVTQ
jgi:hypothetical protein